MTVKKIYFYVFCTFVICEVSGTDYCNINGCEPGQHFMCLFPIDRVSYFCGTAVETGIDDFNKKSLVDSINSRRFANSKEVKELVWNEDLAKMAQRYANRCTTSERLPGCTALSEHNPFYQRIYKGSDAAIPYEAVKHWDLPQDVVFNPSRKTEKLDQVGCGLTSAIQGNPDQRENYLVCNFGYNVGPM